MTDRFRNAQKINARKEAFVEKGYNKPLTTVYFYFLDYHFE